MHLHIKLITDLSYYFGLLSYADYIERIEVSEWLKDTSDNMKDPRAPAVDFDEFNSERRQEELEEPFVEISAAASNAIHEEPHHLELLMMNQWMFTIGDVDCYPSVPHGHLRSKNREWPKLNPYTGRVFSAPHSEVRHSRLNKSEMRLLWNDPKFVEHCREQVLWYSEFAHSYCFPEARRGRLAFPRWRLF